MKELIIIVAVAIIGALTQYQGAIAFPESTENIKNKNKDNRTPLYIPGRCPVDQLLYPGDQDADWICDCRPGYIYYPMNDTCYAAYKQGPCPKNQYLVLPETAVIPRCESNPCRMDGKVRYKSMCWELDKPGGPCRSKEGAGTLGVNATTLSLGCLKSGDPLALIAAPNKHCIPGSKRDHNGKCREEFGS